MLPLFQMSEHKTLPVFIQNVLTAQTAKGKTAPRFSRLQEKVDLRIVAQGLKMSRPLHRPRDGLLIYNGTGAELRQNAEALFHLAFQHLNLHLPHHLHGNLLERLIPQYPQKRFFFFQLSELREKGRRIAALRKNQAVGQHRFQNRCRKLLLKSQSLPGKARRKTGYRADGSGWRFLHRLKPAAEIDTDLIDFIRAAGNRSCFYFQDSACHLQMTQPVSLAVSGNLVDSGSKVLGIAGKLGQAAEAVQQLFYSLQL